MKLGLKTSLLSAFVLAAGIQSASAAGTETPTASTVAPGQSLRAYRDALRVPMIVEGVTNQGWIVGRWLDVQGNSHWFVMNPFLTAFSDIANHHENPEVHILTVSQTDS